MLLLILLGMLLVALLYALRRVLLERREFEEQRDHLAAELEFIKTTVAPVYSLIGPNAEGGGIFKRITEIREITVAILKCRPELFLQEPGLIHWLSVSDEFLCRLCDAAMPKGSNEWCDSQRERWGALCEQAGLTQRIYTDVRQDLGIDELHENSD